MTPVVTPVSSVTPTPVEPIVSGSLTESWMRKNPVILQGENAEAWSVVGLDRC